MGPDSKDAVERVLGHLVDELQQQRSTLHEIRHLLETTLQAENADLANLHGRVTQLERLLKLDVASTT